MCTGLRTPKSANDKNVGDTVCNAELNGNILLCTQ